MGSSTNAELPNLDQTYQSGQCSPPPWLLHAKAVQPAFVLGVFALDDGKVFLLQVLGHRARVAIANLAVVKLADGGDFSRGAGKERFVSDVEFIAGELLFLDRKSVV